MNVCVYYIAVTTVQHALMRHDQIFGYTGMKGVDGTASWANYPESAVWMVCRCLSPKRCRQLHIGRSCMLVRSDEPYLGSL